MIERKRGTEPVPCSLADYTATVKSPDVLRKTRQIRQALARSRDESLTEEERKKAAADFAIKKRSLPGWVFSAYRFDESVSEIKQEDGTKKKVKARWRKQETAHVNGLGMLDIDHVDDPRALFTQICAHVAFRDLMMMAFRTPSGEGLKIVFKCSTAYGNIASNQCYWENQLGIKNDGQVKDASRLSFCVPEEDIYFINGAIFDYYDEEYDKKYTPTYNKGISEPDLFKPQRDDKKESVSAEQGVSAGQDYSQYRYEGVLPVPAIIEAYLSTADTSVGHRHDTLLTMADHLRYVCERNVERVRFFLNQYQWVQDLRAEGDSVDRTIEDGINRTLRKTMPKEMRRAVRLATEAQGLEAKTSEALLRPFEKWGEQLRRLAPDYPCMKELMARVQTGTVPAVVCAGAAFLGTLMTRTFYYFFDTPNKRRRLNYAIYVIGDPGSGKSAINPLYQNILAPIIAADEVSTKAINDYKKERELRNTSTKEQKKDGLAAPEVQLRIHGTRTSNSVLIDDMNNAYEIIDGEKVHLHMITFDSELDAATTASKGGSWIDKSSLELKAFHNEQDNQQYKNNSVSGTFDVFWNYVYCGTPLSLARKVTRANFGTGLYSRLTVLPIAADYFQMMPYDMDGKASDKIDETLREWGYKLDKVRGELPVEPLVRETWNFVNELMTQARIDNDKPTAMLIRRIPYHGLNISIPYIFMRHYDEWEQTGTFKVDDKDKRLINLIMEIQLYSQRLFFEDYAEAYFSGKDDQMDTVGGKREKRSDKIFAQLGAEFTIAQLMEVADLNKQAALTLVSRWRKTGKVKGGKVAEGEKYIKA